MHGLPTNSAALPSPTLLLVRRVAPILKPTLMKNHATSQENFGPSEHAFPLAALLVAMRTGEYGQPKKLAALLVLELMKLDAPLLLTAAGCPEHGLQRGAAPLRMTTRCA